MTAAVLYFPAGAPLTEETLRASNPGLRLVQVTPDASHVPADYGHEEVSFAAKMAKAALSVGTTLVVPAPLQPLVGTLLEGGVDLIDRLLSKAPTKERWTLADIRALNAEIQALEAPRT